MSRLRAARDDLGLSREKVAARLEISSKTLERWEKKRTTAPRHRLIELAELYGVDVETLVDDVVAA